MIIYDCKHRMRFLHLTSEKVLIFSVMTEKGFTTLHMASTIGEQQNFTFFFFLRYFMLLLPSLLTECQQMVIGKLESKQGKRAEMRTQNKLMNKANTIKLWNITNSCVNKTTAFSWQKDNAIT